MFKQTFFMIKTLVATISIIALLQFKIGGIKLETSFYNWIEAVMDNPSVEGVVHGGAQVSRDTWSAVKGQAEKKLVSVRDLAAEKAKESVQENSAEIKRQTAEALEQIKQDLKEGAYPDK